MTTIDVCICTYRRPSLESTLRSVAAQKVPEGVSLHAIIADNDTEPSAEQLVTRLSGELDLPITYVHAPARNISLARNACLEAASGDWLAFLDDDEEAASDWLAKLLAEAQEKDLTAVFGPGIASYTEEVPDWIRRKDYHSNRPQRRNGIVETGHTCNALVRRDDPAVEGKEFDLARGLSGGEDTDWFFRIHQAGGRFGICEEAIVREPVDPARLSFDWIARRKFRSGQSYAAGVGHNFLKQVVVTLMACLKVLFCLAGAAVFFWSETERNYWALRAIFHAGVVSSFFGIKPAELY